MKQIFEPEHGDRVDERDTVFIDANNTPVYVDNGVWQVSVDRGAQIVPDVVVVQDNLRWVTDR